MDALETRPRTAPAARVARRLRVSGVVQGVGFRPYVYRLALQHGVVGWVLNDGEGVLIHAEGTACQVEDFTQAIVPQQPVLARVKDVRVLAHDEAVTEPGHASFGIVSSVQTGRKETVVPTDSYVCADCLAEMRDPADRRHRYPFINCINCGPRYSLIRELPYDRSKTTMAAFAMCADCHREYNDPGNRRFHAQPNACPACGPKLSLASPAGEVAQGDDAIAMAIQALAAGMIVAIKSIGGFHLAANACERRSGSALIRR
jgi:hydrogenase maturation protein HypF